MIIFSRILRFSRLLFIPEFVSICVIVLFPLGVVAEETSDANGVNSPTLDTIWESGPAEDRYCIVFLGDGFTNQEQELYQEAVERIWSTIMAIEPFFSHRNLLNFYRINVRSNESGITNDPNNGLTKDTALGMKAYADGVNHYVLGFENIQLVLELAGAHAPKVDSLVVLGNTTRGMGTATYPIYNSTSLQTPGIAMVGVVDGGGPYAPFLTAHEMGHSVGYLYDEYGHGGSEHYDGRAILNEGINVSEYNATQMANAAIGWHKWLGYEYIPNQGPVGVYEGAYASRFGIYRPTETSVMRYVSLESRYNPVQIERLIDIFYRHVNLLSDYSPRNRVVTVEDVLSVETLEGLDTLKCSWKINGQEIQDHDTTVLQLRDFNDNEGVFEVEVEIIDNSPFIRNSGIRDRTSSRVKWILVTENNRMPYIVSNPVNRYSFLCDSAVFEVVAGGPQNIRYEWFRNGEKIEQSSIFEGINTSRLSINGYDPENEGAYFHCKVSNNNGYVLSESARLNRKSERNSTFGPYSQRYYHLDHQIVELGEEVILQAGYVGDRFSYEWFKNGELIEDASNTNEYRFLATEDFNGSRIKAKLISGINEFFTNEAIIALKDAHCASPRNVVASQNSSRQSVILNWLGQFETDYFQVYRSETAGLGGIIVGDHILGTQFEDTSIESAKEYFYIVVGVNEFGMGLPSAEIAVSTQ